MFRFYEERDHVESYEVYRPRYTKEVTDAFMSFLHERNKQSNSEGIYDLAVDVACGSGQLTDQLASHFKQIIGIDISPVQIKIANERNKFDNIRYVVAPGESIPVENQSVDLITCAAALHWLDFDRFMQECKRILKPDGCLAAMSYDKPTLYRLNKGGIDRKLSFIADQDATDVMRKFMISLSFNPLPGFNIDHDRYLSLFNMIPCEDKKHIDDMKVEFGKKINLDKLQGYIESLAAYRLYMREKVAEVKRQHPDLKDDEIDTDAFDTLKITLNKLKQSWNVDGVDNSEVELGISWDVWLVISARPTPGNVMMNC